MPVPKMLMPKMLILLLMQWLMQWLQMRLRLGVWAAQRKCDAARSADSSFAVQT